jgi:hypothetical protein
VARWMTEPADPLDRFGKAGPALAIASRDVGPTPGGLDHLGAMDDRSDHIAPRSASDTLQQSPYKMRPILQADSMPEQRDGILLISQHFTRYIAQPPNLAIRAEIDILCLV